MIEERNGKRTGFALVFFQNEEIAQKAKSDKHKQSIGKRYVEVLEVGVQDIVQ